MPPHAVQPYLGGSSEQRFMMDLVLTAATVALSVMVVVKICFGYISDFEKGQRGGLGYFYTHVKDAF